MKKITLSFVALAAAAIMAHAQAPAKFNYQGIARNSAGAPLVSRTLGMRITILDGGATGSTAYQETQTVTTNAFGLYNAAIGAGTPVSGSLSSVNWAAGDKYVQVEIDPAGGNNYADLGAAQLLSVPYAMYANNAAGGVSGGTANYIPKFTSANALGISSILETPAGKIAIGTTAPEGRVHVNGTTDSTAFYVTSNYTGAGQNYAAVVFNQSTTTSGSGTPAGIYTEAVPSLTTNQGRGIVAVGGAMGVQGVGLSSATTAPTTGNTIGVYGSSQTNTTAVGVFGTATGYTSAGGLKVGVYGTAANGTNNFAGLFNGNVEVGGMLSKAGGTFKIDHPLDPENKYLYHSFVESPDMMNIYNGNITTDASGFATVTMPGYFDALNKDFRYQLTAIGTFAQAIVAEEMNGNTFRIQTSQPNVKVSWQVTGVREDAYANAHRVQAEVDKEAENKGKYLHAKELGKPESSEIYYQLNRQANDAQVVPLRKKDR
jgi:hypothetical protein